MNPWELSASDLLVWGILLHLIADWPLQNDWMANHKAKRWVDKDGEGVLRNRLMQPYAPWWLRHPAAYVHAGIHTALLALVFGWVALPLGLIHLIIDTRVPVVWWSTKVIKQTQPENKHVAYRLPNNSLGLTPGYDIGTEVRFWTDQVFHLTCVGVAAILVQI